MAQTQYERCMDLVVALLNGIPNAGKIYDHLLIIREEKEFLDALKVTVGGVDQYRGWMVTSAPNNAQLRRIITPTQDEEVIAFELHGYRGINKDQSSEREFYALTETIADALSTYIRAGDGLDITAQGGYVALARPAQIVARKPGQIAGTWVHYAKLTYALVVHRKVTRQ